MVRLEIFFYFGWRDRLFDSYELLFYWILARFKVRRVNVVFLFIEFLLSCIVFFVVLGIKMVGKMESG